MKKKIIGIILTVVVLGSVGIFLVTKNTAIAVTTAPVTEGSIEKYVEELGIILAEQRESVYASAGGKVTALLVNTGDMVKKGDILLKLNDQQLLREIQELEAQEASLTAQYQQAIKPVDPREIEKLKLEQDNMERSLAEAERNAENQKLLYEAGAISQEAYQNVLYGLETQKNNLEKLKLDLAMVTKPNTTNIAAQYEAQLKQLAIQMEALKSRGEDHTVKSPIDGTVMVKAVEVGSYLQPGMLMMEIGNTDKLYVEADILVDDMANVKEGAKVLLSHSNLGITDLEGVVKKIHPRAFSKVSDLGIEQKRVKVEIEILGEAVALKPGYDLDMKIVTEKSEKALLIPENAVFQQGNQYYVFVSQDNRAHLREIQKSIESEKKVEVISGLNKEDMVILSPDETLKDGAVIKVQ